LFLENAVDSGNSGRRDVGPGLAPAKANASVNAHRWENGARPALAPAKADASVGPTA